VTLKAYSLAGCQFDRDNKNAERIKFALNAASHVVDVENATRVRISLPVLGANGSYAPIEVVFEDPRSGQTQAKATVRLGSLTSLDDKTLDDLSPCAPAPEPLLNISADARDDWEAGVAFQAGFIPSDFNWKMYLSYNPDLVLVNPSIDTEIEAKRHFARYGLIEGRNEGRLSRTKYSLPLREVSPFLAAEVTVEGLSSMQRAASFAKLFGINVLGRSTTKVLVVEDVRGDGLPFGAQALQVGEIDISSNPPAFNRPSGIDPNLVSYTMSMDLKIESFPRDWVNVFSTSMLDCCDANTRRPALFISGLRQVAENPGTHVSANQVHIVHGSAEDGLDMIGYPLNGRVQKDSHDNRLIMTRFAANPGQYFNVTWTVDGNTLTTFINGIPTPRGTVKGKFTWGQQIWNWNAYRNQYPGRVENDDGSVKVKNVYWWNRPLSSDEVSSFPSSQLYSSQNRVTLFKYCSFGSAEPGGWEKVLTPGRYPSLEDFGIEDNHLSSLRIQPGTRVTLFSENNFTGESRTLTSDTGCLDGPLNFNDKTSSIIVESISPNESATTESSRRFHFVELPS
jgi:hypothetical protein